MTGTKSVKELFVHFSPPEIINVLRLGTAAPRADQQKFRFFSILLPCGPMKLILSFCFGLAVVTARSFGAESADPVTLIQSNKMAAAFAKGTPLLETKEYKVHARRRDAPGIAEIHTKDTDIFHVLEGSAVLVTGGTAVETKNIAPDELRGARIEGGQSRRLAKGDVIIIPPGVPHWFKEVNGPFVYYVVKVTSQVAKGAHPREFLSEKSCRGMRDKAQLKAAESAKELPSSLKSSRGS